MTASDFFNNETGIRPTRLADWLDAACSKNGHAGIPRILLPMIQRGSVWKPHQVMDLWDTLLRGMPVGSMMASEKKDGRAIDLNKRTVQPITNEMPALALLDGQQRTMAMLLAWPRAPVDMERRIWIDLADAPPADKLFRYHFTTKNQPFGFQRAGPSGQAVGKLSREDRRKALEPFLMPPSTMPDKFAERRDWLWARARPFRGKLPLDLRELIRRHEERELRAYVGAELAEIKGDAIEATVSENLERLIACLARFDRLHLPIIDVPDQHYDGSSDETPESRDPALAVLFQRIGTGGTALSNADYVFSVLKHHNPECHSLVQAALDDENIATLFDPVTLVTTAVRLTAAHLGAADYPKIDKHQFAQLMKIPEFLSSFNSNIASNGPFLNRLSALLHAMRHDGSQGDIGLPKHALCLIDLPVLEAMLLWMQHCHISEIDPATRFRLVRFAIYWRLAVIDRDKADKRIFELLKEHTGLSTFPEKEMVRCLVENELALPMVAPETYTADKEVLGKLIQCPSPKTDDAHRIVRGWERFDVDVLRGSNDAIDGEQRKMLEAALKLYHRFANGTGPRLDYRHKLLLWLQRAYVWQTFEDTPALPGSDDEAPYDFDHIVPQDDWNDWTGSSKDGNPNCLPFYRQDRRQRAEQWIGNSIGNLRVWESSDNRSLGKLSPADRLTSDKDRAATVIGNDEDWEACKSGRHWTRERAAAFQQTIENRTFNLYNKLYIDLNFDENTYYAGTSIISLK